MPTSLCLQVVAYGYVCTALGGSLDQHVNIVLYWNASQRLLVVAAAPSCHHRMAASGFECSVICVPHGCR